MILTGPEIIKEYYEGNITISPFTKNNINPNSYNYKLGDKIKVFKSIINDKPVFEEIDIPENGFMLEPGVMYLSNTLEVIGSKKYAMSLIGKSSIGRLGLFLQISANLGHTNSEHKWTLELFACKRIRIYRDMVIGQLSFWKNTGDNLEYSGFYGRKNNIQESNL